LVKFISEFLSPKVNVDRFSFTDSVWWEELNRELKKGLPGNVVWLSLVKKV
jgi:hypothetical protein